MSAPTENSAGATAVRPFTIPVTPEAELEALRARVAATRWPDQELVTDHSQGPQLAVMQELARYWATEYDWRKCEAKLNALPHFMTEIDGLDIHFIHVRSEHENALPVIITHGWPGSVIELLAIIDPLTNPTAHGASASDAFDVVIPSMPGYGYSGKPRETGWGPGTGGWRAHRARHPPHPDRRPARISKPQGGIVMNARWRPPAGLHTASARLPVEGELPSPGGATGWLNSPPLTPAGLRGKVALIDFWTYTCINWLRQLPYLRAWAGKYSGDGLVVIGVHTPEFPFEHDVDNVRRAVKSMRVDYPVAIDNDYAIWRAFDNHYWPALYFADAQGRIRHHHFGEGEYQQSEMIIQQLLTEAGSGGTGQGLVSPDLSGVEAPADWATLRSPENYTGYERTENFASPSGILPGRRHAYTAPAELRLNHWALSGDWTMEEQAATPNEAGGQIAYRFHARDLHLVMGPAAAGTSVRFRVLLDGQPPGAAHGADADSQGNGTVAEQRLHQLIRQPGTVTDRIFEITFLDPGVQAYAFTFG